MASPSKKQFSVAFIAMLALSFAATLVAPTAARAQTVMAELEKIDTIRKIFGDQAVSSLTSLPPAKYKEARDKALTLADKVKANPFLRDDASHALRANFQRYRTNQQEVVSAISKPDAKEDDLTPTPAESVSAAEPNLEAEPDPTIEAAKTEAVAEAQPEEETQPAAPARKKQLDPDLPDEMKPAADTADSTAESNDRHVSSDESAAAPVSAEKDPEL